MCGIFGFALNKSISTDAVFRVLENLEIHKYPQEATPVGGYGAGIAVIEADGSVILEKVGRVSLSPVKSLEQIVKDRLTKASVLLAHVRMPSPEFLGTAKFRETAQPFTVELDPALTVVSVHNGKVENYKELRAELGQEHIFESEKYELIDSEVIPHYFEELVNEKENANEALDEFYNILQGSNAISLLQIDEEATYMHLVHKGRTRGLTIWTNSRDEVIFCSRKETLTEKFQSILQRGKFEERFSVPYHEDRSFKSTFLLKMI
jgi:glucosamine 6-phosphate synthetase-like amidotransferase/phosphosugar isomerase protein